jgi:hypothetical protein
MRYTAYYIVRADAALLSQMKDRPEADLLCHDQLWTKSEGGRTTKSVDDGIEEFKLLFVAHLHHDYLRHAPADQEQREFQRLLGSILGAPPWGASTFDRWWTLERLEAEGDADAVAARLPTETVSMLRGADSWRAWLLKSKQT